MSEPASVRAPHTTRPAPGKLRSTLMPNGFSAPETASPVGYATPVAPATPAASPAGAFHTPRSLSVRAITPATAPDGGRPVGCESGVISRGQYSAPCAPSAANGPAVVTALAEVTPESGSTSRNAFWVLQYASAAV